MNDIVEFFDALSDETRLRILVLLYSKELCVCEMCEILEISQPKVSRHLAKLRDKGFVRDERQNQWIFYYLNLEDEQMLSVIREFHINAEKYALITRDLERLKEKASGKRMCSRIK